MATPELPENPLPVSHPTSTQRRILWTALTALAVLALVGVAGLVFFGFVAFLSWCYPILLPIGLAVMIALLLEPVVSFTQKRWSLRRENASLLACVVAAAAVLLFWAFLSGRVINEGGKFFQNLPKLIDAGINSVDAYMNGQPLPNQGLQPDSLFPLNLHAPEHAPAEPPSTNTLTVAPQLSLAPAPTAAPEPAQLLSDKSPAGTSAFQEWLKTNLPAIEQTVQKSLANVVYSALGPVGQAFGFLLGFGFVPIYVYYFLADEELITKHWHEYVPLRRSPFRDEVVSVLREISLSLVGYLHGQIIVAACNGVLTFIGLAIIGVPYSLVLGIITGALSVVPFLGIICSIIPALLLGFLAEPMFGLPWLRPVLVLAVFALVQLSESMFISPRVQSHSTGLHPLTIIVGILFWSLLLPGLLGPIVAVPLTCAGAVLLKRYVWVEKKQTEF